ncbi:hypothetical protein JHK86_047262 [Glycine max]|nr:hypothetical protein JHK86_047262 [Glycine max]
MRRRWPSRHRWAFGGMIFVLIYYTAGIPGRPLQRQQLEVPHCHCHLRLRHPHCLRTRATSPRRRNVHFTALDSDPRSRNYLRRGSVSNDIDRGFRNRR